MRFEGVNCIIVELGIPDFLPDRTGVGVGLKLCFFSTEVCTLSFEKDGIFLDILYLPELHPIIDGAFKNELIICFR
jgi:hypothetical protein